MIHVVAFHAAFLACAWYALTAGGRPERAAMLAQAVALILTLSTRFIHVSGDFASLRVWWAITDGLLLLALTLIALRADRLWPIVLAGLQLSASFVHLTKTLFPDLPASGYAVFLQMWAWPMLAVTAWGTRRHQKRVRCFGSERDWKAKRPLQPHGQPG
jgi:hypothetical protein